MSTQIRDATKAAGRLFGRLLAEEVASASGDDAGWLDHAQVILHRMDRLEVVGDEGYDRALESLARAEGAVWLELAENGSLDGTDYVAHVLYHRDVGGYAGSPFVEHLMQTIATADNENRDALSLCFPELVGLYRAATELSDGQARLLAVLDRR